MTNSKSKKIEDVQDAIDAAYKRIDSEIATLSTDDLSEFSRVNRQLSIDISRNHIRILQKKLSKLKR